MANIPSEIKQFLKEYINEIRKNFPVERVILFGSYAKDRANPDSDIDLAVFSNFFYKKNPVDVTTLLLSKARKFHVNVEVFGFTNKDYDETNGNDFVKKIKREGIEVYAKTAI